MKLLLPLTILVTPAFADIGACPITADFVTQPETIQSTQQMGQLAFSSTTRRAFVDGAMVQIECTDISPEQVFPGQDDATILANYARFWSIEPTGPAYQDGERLALEGTKEIQGIEVTYTYRLVRFAGSFAMIATGVPGGGKPRDVERFLDSIEVEAAVPEPFTDAEIKEGRRSHIAACLPTVRADNEARQLGLSDLEITYFCSCTGERYWAEFSRMELRALAAGDDASVEERRRNIQVSCLEDAVK